MPFIPTVNTVRVDCLQDLNGNHCDNTLWYLAAGGPWDLTSMAALGAAINTVWTTYFPALHNPSWSYRGCVVTDQSSDSAPAVDVAVTETFGTLEADVMPGNVSWCIKFLTSGRGRSSRGRNYFVGIPRTLVVNDELDSTYAGQIITAYDHFLVPSLDVDGSLVVVSHRHNKVDRTAGLAQPVTDITYTDLLVDSQRRRLTGRGN